VKLRLRQCWRFVLALPRVLPYKVRFARAVIRNRFRAPAILFRPRKPHFAHVIWKLCHEGGYRITTDPNAEAVLTFQFQDRTQKRDDPVLTQLAQTRWVVNLGVTDISKSRVDEAFHKVFGYSPVIDPRTYKGSYVRKSESNARHDGRILTQPSEPEPGYIYQKLIDTAGPDGRLQDLRLSVFGRAIAFAKIGYRHADEAFGERPQELVMVDPDSILSTDEKEKVLVVCDEMGLDFGELDALRDREDGRLYIVDVNDTPSGIYPDRGPAFRSKLTALSLAALRAELIDSERNQGQFDIPAVSDP